MKVVKRINNNAVLAVDGDGKQVVAMGRALAQAKRGDELDLGLVERTYYEIDPRYLDMLVDLPAEAISIAGETVDLAQGMLSYQFGPNACVALADHLTFMVDRAKKGLVMRFPLTYDVQQNYPVEFKLGEHTRNRCEKEFGVRLPKSESTGIALCLINNIFEHSATSQDAHEKSEEIFSQVVALIEKDMGTMLDHEGFEFARFATHVNYLLQRLSEGQSLLDGNVEPSKLLESFDETTLSCVDDVASFLSGVYGKPLSDEERFYLYLHVSRICNRLQADVR